MKKGFTLLEIMIVIGLAGLMALLGMVSFGRVRQREGMAAAAMRVAQILTLARAKSIAGENDKAWKVVVEEERVLLQDELGTTVEQYSLPVNYGLFGPVDEIVFARADGRVEDCETGCVLEIREKEGALSHQVRVLFSGAVEY